MSQPANLTCTIACKDIILREYRLEDLDRLYAITQEPEVMEFLPDWNVPREQRREWLANYEIVENDRFLERIARQEEAGELRLRLALVSKETGEVIGWCCSGMKEELPPPNREIMYAISNRHTNKGYAAQALQGLTDFLFRHAKVEELHALALDANLPSNRVIRKSGYTLAGSIALESGLYHHYRITGTEWAGEGQQNRS